MKAVGRWWAVVAIVCLFVWSSGCEGDFPPGPFPPEFPPLSDAIPYDALAPGMLVFQRIGPPENRYVGTYVVATAMRRSLEISKLRINDPAVSPDGQRFAFTTYTTVPTSEDVFIMANDATEHHWVSDIEGRERSPSWTFDGKQILYFSVPFASNGDSIQLYRQSPVRGARDRKLVFDSGKEHPRIRLRGPVSASPTGELLVAGDGIWMISGDNADANLLIPPPGGGRELHSPVWSPDGKSIAVLSVTRHAGRTTSVAVVVYAAGTGADTLVSLPASSATEWPGNNNHSLCWSPDGSQIAFTRPDGRDVGAHIYVIRVDKTGLTQVTLAEGVTDRSLSWGAEIPSQ